MGLKKQYYIPSHKAFRMWRKCMKLGQLTGCHQMPDRSFFIKGCQLPVCARCCGVILGYLFAIPSFLFFRFHALLSILGCLGMLTDWGLQALKLKPSTNIRRFITGILGGYGIMTLQLRLLKELLKILQSFIKR